MVTSVSTSSSAWLRDKVTKPKPLAFYDSLQKTVRPFHLAEGLDTVRWYSCGPTVYDASHMGHARNYVTTDTLRRLVRDYFGFKVKYVQNVTDVDDKIIIKARHNLFFEHYKREHAQAWQGQRETLKSWWALYRTKHLPHSTCDMDEWSRKIPATRDIIAFPKDQMIIDTLSASALALMSSSEGITADQFFEPSRDIIIHAIDTPEQRISNEDIFKSTKELTTYWEQKFDEDMANLNVLKPDKVVRVSEYMDAIITFVETIIKNGYAYEASGSVYFNVAHFVSSGHDYAKLKPTSMTASADSLLAEAEGTLSAQISQAKKSQRDFALWKASKKGEPYWPSPWGDGRPGWHIECSAMASCEFGSSMDIHSGGEDLTFPHHDNELAQSEAAHSCHEWVRYFLHTGHLHIHGMKMSKSLKNFITIDQVLTTEGMTSRTMRILFLSGKWRGRVDYNDDLIRGVRNTEQKFSEFFVQIRALMEASQASSGLVTNGVSAGDALSQNLQSIRDGVDEALADDFDTPQMLSLLRELLSEANKNLSSPHPHLRTLLAITAFFTDLFEIVGIEASQDRIGWVLNSHNQGLMDEVQRVAEYRQRVRVIATQKLDEPALSQLTHIMTDFETLTIKTPELAQFRSALGTTVHEKPTQGKIMAELDTFRDYTLVDLGIALDDKKDSFILKSGDRSDLIAKREQKLQEVREKASKKEEVRRKEQEAMERGRGRASDMFRDDVQYVSFDGRGIPTHVKDESGATVEVSKSLSKKLVKEYNAQEKLNQKYDVWVTKHQS